MTQTPSNPTGAWMMAMADVGTAPTNNRLPRDGVDALTAPLIILDASLERRGIRRSDEWLDRAAQLLQEAIEGERLQLEQLGVQLQVEQSAHQARESAASAAGAELSAALQEDLAQRYPPGPGLAYTRVSLDRDPSETVRVTVARERYEELRRLVPGDVLVVNLYGAERHMTSIAYLSERIDALQRLIGEQERRLASIATYREIPRGPQPPRITQIVQDDRGRQRRIVGLPEPVSPG